MNKFQMIAASWLEILRNENAYAIESVEDIEQFTHNDALTISRAEVSVCDIGSGVFQGDLRKVW